MNYDYIVIGAGSAGRDTSHKALGRPQHLGAPARGGSGLPGHRQPPGGGQVRLQVDQGHLG